MNEKEALNKVIDAWESLKGGQRQSARDVEDWLTHEMKPAIDNARKVLGRPIPRR